VARSYGNGNFLISPKADSMARIKSEYCHGVLLSSGVTGFGPVPLNFGAHHDDRRLSWATRRLWADSHVFKRLTLVTTSGSPLKCESDS
jgi:hypothetical protein